MTSPKGAVQDLERPLRRGYRKNTTVSGEPSSQTPSAKCSISYSTVNMLGSSTLEAFATAHA